MSVPSPSSWASTSARLDAEIPTTATIAAMPMAMPRAVSAVRDRRARRPTVPTRARSTRRSRLTSSPARVADLMPRPSTTSSVIRPSRIATRRGRGPRSSRSWVISTIVRPRSWRSASSSTIASLVRLSRLPVGSSARTIAGSPTRARAMATRWRSPPDERAGPVQRPLGEADGVERLVRLAQCAGGGPRRRTAARRRRSPARSAARRGGTAGTRTRCAGRARPPAGGRRGG